MGVLNRLFLVLAVMLFLKGPMALSLEIHSSFGVLEEMGRSEQEELADVEETNEDHLEEESTEDSTMDDTQVLVVNVPSSVPLKRSGAFPVGKYGSPYSNRVWHPDFSQYIKEQLTDNHFRPLMMNASGSASSICPNFTNLNPDQRVIFWTAFFKGLAKAESGYDYNSNPKTGIMQLTCDGNARTGYGCTCKSPNDLKFNPFKSIDCAMRIVNHWAAKGKFIYGKIHPYFETMRPKAGGGAHLRKILSEVNANAGSLCRKPETAKEKTKKSKKTKKK